ncbi:MAG: RNase H family protein [Halanaerobium sp.]|nr:RNase H family protein [Halanaerobium sp.]
MKWKYEEKLLQKAAPLIERLGEAGLQADIDLIRDYLLKLKIFREDQDYGYLNLYYSPRKDTFTLKSHELKEKSIMPEIEEAWRDKVEGQAGKKKEPIQHGKGYHIYVDGSYLDGVVGYGYVILKDDSKVQEEAGTICEEPYNLHHQVGGEIKAVEAALDWCSAAGVREVTIYHDFLNLEKWAKGEYKTNHLLTKNYRENVEDSGVKIRWQKVPGHQGVKWNEFVDKLAREQVLKRLQAREG